MTGTRKRATAGETLRPPGASGTDTPLGPRGLLKSPEPRGRRPLRPLKPLKAAAKRLLLASGAYARRLRALRFPGVAVLCYHGVRGAGEAGAAGIPASALQVGAGELEAHCRLLAAHCHPISLARWREALAGGEELPPRPVLVTFDDGYRSVHRLALPVLRRHGVPAVVFACSDPIERRELFWFDALARSAGAEAVERAKELPWERWRELTAGLAAKAAPGDPDEPLSAAELGELAAHPLIEIGGHTASHPILARAERARQREEIVRNRERLETWTGRPVAAFAYPNGRPGRDYGEETVALLAELGFDIAFNTRHGFALPGEPPHERSRFLMLAGVSAGELAHRLCTSWWPREHASPS